MKQAVIVAKEKVELWEKEIPQIGDDEVLVRVKACGLCTFEQRYFTGMKEQYPFNGGHELCGHRGAGRQERRLGRARRRYGGGRGDHALRGIAIIAAAGWIICACMAATIRNRAKFGGRAA